MENKVIKSDFFKKKLGTTDVTVQNVQKIKQESTKDELKRTATAEKSSMKEKSLVREKSLVKEKSSVKETSIKIKQDLPKREKISRKISYVMQEAGELFIKNDMKSLALGMDQVLKEEQKDFFTVAVVGEFSRGKSSFVNHLLERKILPVSNLPTTAMMTRIRHRKEEKIAVYNDKGQRVFQEEI